MRIKLFSFRSLLGLFCFVQFSYYFVYARELFSRDGVFPEPMWPTSFPGILNIFDQPIFVEVFVGSLLLASVLLFVGIGCRAVAFFLWYGLASLVARDPYIANVSAPYLGWLLLATAVIPRRETQAIPKELYQGAWLILGVTYFLSGCYKLTSPAWRHGEALSLILSSPVGRESLVPIFSAYARGILPLVTYSVIIVQMVFLPLCLFKKTRPIGWILVTLLQIFNGAFTKMTLLAAGVLLFHVFVFDEKWLLRLRRG